MPTDMLVAPHQWLALISTHDSAVTHACFGLTLVSGTFNFGSYVSAVLYLTT